MNTEPYLTKSHRTVIAWATALLFLSSSYTTKAQTTLTGAFGGAVVNKKSGTPIPGAIVQITSKETKITVSISTDVQGRFYKERLTPGVYSVHISRPGFKSKEVLQRVFVNRINEMVPVPVELDEGGKQRLVALGATRLPAAKELPTPSYGGLAIAALPRAAILVEPTEGGEPVRGVIPSDQILFVFNDIPARRYRVKATLEGYQSVEKEVVISARKTEGLTLNLEPEKSLSVVDKEARYYALVIGNNSYQNLPRLRTAENDAKVVDAILREQYGFQTKLLLNASREQIVVALNEYRRKLDQNTNLLIYYAGHGYNDAEVRWTLKSRQKRCPV